MRVFITGASSGLGRALSVRCLRRGDEIWGIARREPLLASIAAEAGGPGSFRYAVCDVTRPSDIEATARRMREADFLPDWVVLNAGIHQPEPTSGEIEPGFTQVVRTNFDGALAWVGHFLPPFLSRGSGHFIAISSLSGLRGTPYSAAYCASKAALTTALEALRTTYGPRGVHFTVVQPGMMATSMSAHVRKGFLPCLPVEQAAEHVLRAAARKRPLVSFPWTTALATRILAWLPAPLYDWTARTAHRCSREGSPGPSGGLPAQAR